MTRVWRSGGSKVVMRVGVHVLTEHPQKGLVAVLQKRPKYEPPDGRKCNNGSLERYAYGFDPAASGKVEEGEDFEQARDRELAEECGPGFLRSLMEDKKVVGPYLIYETDTTKVYAFFVPFRLVRRMNFVRERRQRYLAERDLMLATGDLREHETGVPNDLRDKGNRNLFMFSEYRVALENGFKRLRSCVKVRPRKRLKKKRKKEKSVTP